MLHNAPLLYWHHIGMGAWEHAILAWQGQRLTMHRAMVLCQCAARVHGFHAVKCLCQYEAATKIMHYIVMSRGSSKKARDAYKTTASMKGHALCPAGEIATQNAKCRP